MLRAFPVPPLPPLKKFPPTNADTCLIPTPCRLSPSPGDHFGMVGQLMFSKNSVVEAAMSQFTSQQAKNDARKARADGTALRSEAPQSRL